ncbi:hypothetical protein [uncultured Clostridium sp.]|uniref:hypothetical protein n=1 Tax=uncultured Clostridium sp. TaxID=59620 RepID=UPI0032170D55
MINTDKTILLHYNVDSEGNPIAVKIDNEVKQVSPIHHAVQLSQVPDEKYRMVVVDDLGNELIEVFNMDEIKENNYYINYTSSVVYFHPSKANKIYIFNYFGLGLEMVGASRIYDESSINGQFIVKTIQEIIDKGRECINALNTIGDAVKLLQRIENYIIVATELDIALKEDIAIGQPLLINLNTAIETGTQLKTDLSSKISTGTTLKNELDSRISTGTILKSGLDTNIEEGTILKNNLETLKVLSDNKKYTITTTMWGNIDPTTLEYSYVLEHDLNSRNLHITAYENLKNVSIGAEIIDETHVRFTSDTKNITDVILSSGYYGGYTSAKTETDITNIFNQLANLDCGTW